MINMLILTNYMLVAFEIRYVQRLISNYGSDSFSCLCICITWVLTFCPKVIRSITIKTIVVMETKIPLFRQNNIVLILVQSYKVLSSSENGGLFVSPSICAKTTAAKYTQLVIHHQNKHDKKNKVKVL